MVEVESLNFSAFNHNYQIKEVLDEKFVAITLRISQTIVGHASLRIEDISQSKKFILENIHIDPYYQKRGLGSLLLGKIESMAKKNKISQIELSSISQAEGFYLTHGYKVQLGKKTTPDETPFIKNLDGHS